MAIALPPQDELLRLTGSTNTPLSTITTTTTGTGAYFGADRTVNLYLVALGAVSGTSPTLTAKIQDSADGSSYTDMGVSWTAITTTMSTATGSLADFPMQSVRTRPGRPYLKSVLTLTGTSPSFGSVGILHGPALPW